MMSANCSGVYFRADGGCFQVLFGLVEPMSALAPRASGGIFDRSKTWSPLAIPGKALPPDFIFVLCTYWVTVDRMAIANPAGLSREMAVRSGPTAVPFPLRAWHDEHPLPASKKSASPRSTCVGVAACAGTKRKTRRVSIWASYLRLNRPLTLIYHVTKENSSVFRRTLEKFITFRKA